MSSLAFFDDPLNITIFNLIIYPISPCGAHTLCAIILCVRVNYAKMTQAKDNVGESRHWKHAPDAFRVSLCLSVDENAIATLTDEECQCNTLLDVLANGDALRRSSALA